MQRINIEIYEKYLKTNPSDKYIYNMVRCPACVNVANLKTLVELASAFVFLAGSFYFYRYVKVISDNTNSDTNTTDTSNDNVNTEDAED